MKKATMNTILSLISTIDTPEAEEVRAEITAELAKGQAKAEANRAVYTEMREKVIDAIRLAGVPVSANDIAESTGLSRGKIVHGLTNYWTSEVKVDRSGRVNMYSLV